MLYVVYLALYIVIGYGAYWLIGQLNIRYEERLKEMNAKCTDRDLIVEYRKAQHIERLKHIKCTNKEYNCKFMKWLKEIEKKHSIIRIVMFIFGLLVGLTITLLFIWIPWPIVSVCLLVYKIVLYKKLVKEVEVALGN